ncbi:hypothetical protein ACFFMR_26840 [Micromonospora andamanensis]|uniref:Exo-alpha-sialidase n=1 Tax=Micromonospora andamanensis TaxID=1287068 RepID=A0ABQ4HSG1_9ACTN|nr:hypothetical protein [Micromonospora andamanensis]GIJ08589.1 hypothetical protein Van01_18030 [Micromonospora andamanensis]GIJ41387.1 hypothetical protein Vwe01_47120 [Micromonospora andamanensis]
MTMRQLRSLSLLALVVALAGCSIGDVRRTAPAPEPTLSDSASPPPVPRTVAETRTTRLAVAERYDQPYVEFVDAERGYALFAACDGRPPGGSDCPALLWSTGDGGRSWQSLRHPKPVAENQQLYATVEVLALWAEPHGWWTSTNGGETFRHSPGEAAPASWQATQGRFQVIEESGKAGRWDGRRLRPLPTQPPLSAIHTVAVADTLIRKPDGTEFHAPLVATGLSGDGRPRVAESWDEGRSWRSGEPLSADGEVGVLRLLLRPDEWWLIGERPDRTGFPALWRSTGSSNWFRVYAEGHPESGRVVPLGGSTAAVISPRGAGAVVGGRYLDLPWPVTAEHSLRLLPDGTLFAVGPQGVLLGTGQYAERSWVAINLVGD